MSCSMKWNISTAKTTKITRAATTPRHGLEHYCRELNSWPRSWMGLEKDLPPGEQLVTLFPSVPGALGNVELVAKNDPEARRQHVGIRRRVHHRTQLHAFAQKGACGESSGRSDQGRRPHSPSRRVRGTTAILRVHLPKALEIPQSITGLNVGQTTHRFLRRGIEIAAFSDLLEVFGRVFLRPEQLPAWAIRGQFL